MNENQIGRHIVECAIEVHRNLSGPSLLETAYEQALVWELKQRDLSVKRQVELPIRYKDQTLRSPLRIDMIAGSKAIIDCKAVMTYSSILEVQILTYLRLTSLKLGMIINFVERRVKDSIHQVVDLFIKTHSLRLSAFALSF